MKPERKLNIKSVKSWMVRFTKVTHFKPGSDVVYGIGIPTDESPSGDLMMVARKKDGRWFVPIVIYPLEEFDATEQETKILEALPNDGMYEELCRTREEEKQRQVLKGLN